MAPSSPSRTSFSGSGRANWLRCARSASAWPHLTRLVTVENLLVAGFGAFAALYPALTLARYMLEAVSSEGFTMTAIAHPQTYLLAVVGALAVVPLRSGPASAASAAWTSPRRSGFASEGDTMVMNRKTHKPKSISERTANEPSEFVAPELPVDYDAAAAKIPVRHSNEVIAQTLQDEVFISFFFAAQPVDLGVSGERQNGAEARSQAPECVARISMSPNQLKDTVRILLEQIDKCEAASERADTDVTATERRPQNLSLLTDPPKTSPRPRNSWLNTVGRFPAGSGVDQLFEAGRRIREDEREEE